MSEQVNDMSQRIEARETILELATERINIIEQAARDIGGPNAVVGEIFPAPMQKGEARMDAATPDWSDEQEIIGREATNTLGYGSVENVPSGLSGALVLHEAGLAWKFDFEETLTATERPSGVAWAGSQWAVANEKEQAHVQKRHGLELPIGATQYDIARWLAGRRVLEHEEKIMPIGYEISEGNPTIKAPTGQVQFLGNTILEGTNTEIPDYLIRTDREPLPDGKYRYQPDSAALFGLMSDMLRGQGDVSTPVVLATTQLYASRVIDAMRAGLLHDRAFGVAMSGRATRAEILDEPLQDDLPLEQVRGELHVAHHKYTQLKDLAESQLAKLHKAK